MTFRRAARRDANHAEVVEALLGIGAVVLDNGSVGDGNPDLWVGFRGNWTAIEVKDGKKSPSKRRLTAAQEKLHQKVTSAGCAILVVKNVDEALAIFGARAA